MRAFRWANSGLWVALLVVGILAGNFARADFRFGVAVNPGPPLNSPHEELGPSISPDGCAVYFFSDRPGGYGDWDIWMTNRPSTHEGWSSPVNLGPEVNSSAMESFPCISADGLTLYFCRGPRGAADTWVTTRDSTDAAWGSAMRLDSPINVPGADDYRPFISDNNLSMFFVSDRPGGYGGWDLWVSTRVTADENWGTPVNLGAPINSASHESRVVLSVDGMVMLFQSNRPGGGGEVIYMSTRESPGGPWSDPVNLGPVLRDFPMGFISNLPQDGRTLYVFDHPSYAPRPGGYGKTDIWYLPIDPIVDFNGDGTVDGADIVIMTAHWGEDCPSYDIGPTPFGDGVIDVQDVIILADYIGQRPDDPTLVAHWPLDETDGIVVPDYAGANDGVIIGVAQWRPQGGTIGGALELNGMTFVTAEPPLSPGAGPFSILAWIRDGAPGQVIISQEGSANWLMADAVTGVLTTGLSTGGRTARGLSSQTIITDGNWHRIALAWDGVSRRLCVDNMLVAEDAQSSLASSWGKLAIGCDKNMTPGSFWSGLIDDVRIYNRAIRP